MIYPLLDDVENLDWQLSSVQPSIGTKYIVNSAISMIHTRTENFIRSKLKYQKKTKGNKYSVIRIYYYHITGELRIEREVRHQTEYWNKTVNRIETELCRNEEQYFMQSTLNDFSEISFNDMLRLTAIVDKLEKKVLYGK